MTSEIYRVESNETYGRYMVSNRLIKPGELILKENPILLAPIAEGCLICFACSKLIRNADFVFCPKCSTAILCSSKCAGQSHPEEECKLLKNTKVQDNLTTNSQTITTLRCLLLREYKPEAWSTLMQLEGHLEQRRDTPVWRKCKTCIEDVLREFGLLSEADIQSELVQKICGIVDVNTFEVRPSRESGPVFNPELQCLRGLYPKAALMAHDCIGNTHLAVDDGHVLTIHASVEIPEGEAVFFNYSNTLQGTFERKQHLREGKYFECTCRRCCDPSELGTELSTLICPKCKAPALRPTLPGNATDSKWQCCTCNHPYKEGLIRTTLRECRSKILELDPTNLNEMEKLLKKLSLTLGPQHYLILELQQNLVGLYTQWIPNKHNLMRKAELCQQLLPIFAKLEPGISRMQAIALYELQSAKVDLAHKLYNSKDINGEEFLSKLLEAEGILKEASKYLLYEPFNSPEGALVQTALKELKMLRNSISQLQKTVLMKPVKEKAKIVESKAEKKKHKNKNKK